MKDDWKKKRAHAVRHARLMKRKPELREALYGKRESPDFSPGALADRKAGSRETAQRENDNA